MPLIRSIFNDAILRDISVAFTNDATDFVADRIFPRVNVDKKSGHYFVYDRANLRRSSAKRTGRARASEVTFNMTKTAYGPLQERSLSSWIEKDELTQADDPYSPREDHTAIVTESMMVDHEAEVAAVVTTAASYAAAHKTTLSGTNQWSDYTNSTPFSDIRTAMDAVIKDGFGANTLILPYPVFSILSEHPDLLERVKYNSLGVLTQEMMAKLFKVDNLIVPKARFNSAAEGATDVVAYVWGNFAVVAKVEQTPSLRRATLGYTLQLTADLEVDNWERDDGKGEWVQVTDYYEPKLVAAEAGYLITNPIA